EPERYVEPGIRLVIHGDVLLAGGPHDVPTRVSWALMLVEENVEQRTAVARPGHAAVRVLDDVGQIRSSGDVAEPDRIELRPFVIDCVGEHVVIGTARDASEMPV